MKPRQRGGWTFPCRVALDRSGTTAIEFALLAPILFTLVLGGIEFGRFIWTQAALDYAVQEGARCGIYNPDNLCSTGSEVQTFAADAAPQLKFPATIFTVNSAASCGYQVSASYPYPYLIQGLAPVSPTLTASACFPAAAT